MTIENRIKTRGADVGRALYGNMSRNAFGDVVLQLASVELPADTERQVIFTDAAFEAFDGLTRAHMGDMN